LTYLISKYNSYFHIDTKFLLVYIYYFLQDDDEMLCSFFDCPITNFVDKRVLLYLDQATWDQWDIVFYCCQLGTLKCSLSQPDFENYKTNNLHSLKIVSHRTLQGLTNEEIAFVEDKLLYGTIWFFIPPNYPTNAIK
jgi:hypothetical protein